MAELTQNEKRLLAVLETEKKAEAPRLASLLGATPEAVVQWAHLAQDKGLVRTERGEKTPLDLWSRTSRIAADEDRRLVETVVIKHYHRARRRGRTRGFEALHGVEELLVLLPLLSVVARHEVIGFQLAERGRNSIGGRLFARAAAPFDPSFEHG
jgi:hypothetical protein